MLGPHNSAYAFLDAADIHIIKRASGGSEAFSLVMKTHNFFRLRVLTRNTCLHLVYVSSPGVCVHNWHICPQLAYVSSPGEHVFALNRYACPSMSTPLLGMRTKIMRLLSWTVDRCHYAVLFKGISIRSTPEIVLSSKKKIKTTRKRR